ncbi:MAG: hypothetical protein IPO21_14540 [Bacteroidales bacterium]|nr:hypothetical protein [Bacteroidales bacterium]
MNLYKIYSNYIHYNLYFVNEAMKQRTEQNGLEYHPRKLNGINNGKIYLGRDFEGVHINVITEKQTDKPILTRISCVAYDYNVEIDSNVRSELQDYHLKLLDLDDMSLKTWNFSNKHKLDLFDLIDKDMAIDKMVMFPNSQY